MPLDRGRIDQMVADVGPEAFRRLAVLFQEEARRAVRDILRLAEAPGNQLPDKLGHQPRDQIDWRELGRQAHSLKHATASFGLSALAEVTLEIERAADAGDVAAAERGIKLLVAACEARLEEFDNLIGAVAMR